MKAEEKKDHCPTYDHIYPLGANTQSTLHEGMETLFVPLYSPHITQKILSSARTGKWWMIWNIMQDLGRPLDIPRIHDIKVHLNQTPMVVELRLRQPGLQFEHYLSRDQVGVPFSMAAEAYGAVQSGEVPWDNR